MINKNTIENSLRLINEVIATLESWKTKSVIVFEQQQEVAEKLSQALANVWSLDAICEKVEAAEAKAAEELERVNECKSSLLKALTSLREELNKEAGSHSPEPFNMDSDKIEIEENTPIESFQEYSQNAVTITEETATTMSIVDRFSIYDEDEPALATPINRMADAIGIIDKFLFVKELFNGNENEFQHTVEKVDKMSNLAEAQSFIATVFQHIDKNDHVLKQFSNLVARRYMNT